MITKPIQHKLQNGLRIFLQEVHTAPVISTWIWYGVGSRNEQKGKTGLSHWVEHMQFKGTQQSRGEVWEHAIARTGGHWNAFTSTDWTTYFETLPSTDLALALSLEADRMVNSLFDPQEVETERGVILSELEGNENDPYFRLNEAIQLKAYKAHPYRNEVIGSRSDLLKLTREDLYGHYRSYYQPANATLCLAGDFDSQEALRLIEEYFAPIPSLPFELPCPTPEPRLEGFHQVEVQGPGETPFFQLSYRTPAANHPDFFAFTILDSLLGGPSSLNMFGSGSVRNRSSRLYRGLIEGGYAAGFSAGINATIDPGTWDLSVTARPDCPIENALRVSESLLDEILNHPVLPQEIERAVKQARALFAYGSDNISNLAFWMGYTNSFADYDWFLNYVENLQAVSPARVLAVAQEYLNPERRVLGFYRPKNKLRKS